MNLSVSHTFVLVDDQEKALRFYRDLLGLEVKADVDFGAMRWLTVASPSQPDVEIVLHTPASFFSAEDQKSLLELLAKGVLGTVIFRTDNLDEVFEKLYTSGVEVEQEPIEQEYGVRDCAFRDPSGNSIRFSEPLPSSRP